MKVIDQIIHQSNWMVGIECEYRILIDIKLIRKSSILFLSVGDN